VIGQDDLGILLAHNGAVCPWREARGCSVRHLAGLLVR
jgi:hypothetical protein